MSDLDKWADERYSQPPEAILLLVVFGGFYYSAFADFPFWREEVEGKTLKQAVNDALASLRGDQRQVAILELRYGLRDGYRHTLEEIGGYFDVTRERIRGIEAKALRLLRHSSRSRHLKPYIHDLGGLDYRVSAARQELFGKLAKLYPGKVAYTVVMNLKREELRQAFKSTEDALRFSCGRNISYCMNCLQPLPPGWSLCSEACRRAWSMITVICAHCGKPFIRHIRLLILRRKGELKGTQRNYCCLACMRRKDGTGEPCLTCGRPRVLVRQKSL